MDPLLEGDRLREGELNDLCCKDTHEVVTNFGEMSSCSIDQHLYELFRCLEGHKSHEYMRKWLGFFCIVHRQAIMSKAGRYMELKKLSIEEWSQSVKLNRRGDILSLFTLCALTSRHAMVHLRNGNLWTTVNAPDSYDHDKLLSICDVHLAYVGNGQFAELQRKTDSTPATSISHNTLSASVDSINTAGSANKNGRTTSPSQLQVVGTIKSDPDTLDALLSQDSESTRMSTSMSDSNLIKPSLVKLRRLSENSIKLWTTPKPSTSHRVQLNTVQTFIPVKPMKTSSKSVLTGSGKHTRCKNPASNMLSGRSKSYYKPKRRMPSSPVPSSRVTRTQKIRAGMKSPVLKLVQGLKTYKHRYNFKCVVNPCNRRFATVRDWNRHHQLFHKTYLKCSECRKRFVTPSSRRDHMYSHRTHEYKCSICKRTFYFPSELQLHRTVHCKTKYYRCQEPDCDKIYKWKQDLTRHVKSHEKVRFSCEQCNYSSTEKRLLKRHVLSHSLKKTYYCAHCHKRYRHYNSLNRHMQKCIE